MFDDEFVDQLTEAARVGSDDALRVMAGLAGEARDFHVVLGNDVVAEGLNAIMCACLAVLDERARLARLDFDPGVTSFPDPDMS